MPNATVYIRKSNRIAWESIGDKSAWVNDMLEKNTPVASDAISVVEAGSTLTTSERENPSLKRACCLQPTPCKHWVWDGVKEGYVNSITGEVKTDELL